ncbi:hypothetical protein BDY24DRAFT_417432 [Mrakia frigida]|uniref:uncharacterized protein n=1 Tax=Mrakia frigida TaxID=29902 RepID=UPI003FCC24A2
MFVQTVATLVAVGSTFVSGAVIAPRVHYTATGVEPPVEWAYPVGRDIAMDSQDTLNAALGVAPCGEGSVIDRVNYPLNDGKFSLHIWHASYNMDISYTTDSIPTADSTFTTFDTLSQGDQIGQVCLDTPDFDTAYGYAIGQNLTLQLKFTSGDNNDTFYACADVALATADDSPSFSFCYNATESESVEEVTTAAGAATTATITTASSTATAASVVNAASSSSGLSSSAAGGIGAIVTLVVVALLLAAAWKFGFLNARKTRKVSPNAGGHQMMNRTTSTASTHESAHHLSEKMAHD